MTPVVTGIRSLTFGLEICSREEIMKRALLIGIDDYDNFSDLTGCVTDAKKMRDMLKFNEDGTTNYDCRLITSRDPKPITGEFITTVLDELFYDFTGEILVYFSGHGAQKHTGNQIATQNGNSIIAGKIGRAHV